MKAKFQTEAAHAGEEKKLVAGAVAPAIVQTTNFQWKTVEEFEKYLAGDPRYYIYTRYTNPTLEIAEKKLARLENVEKALVFLPGWRPSPLPFSLSFPPVRKSFPPIRSTAEPLPL